MSTHSMHRTSLVPRPHLRERGSGDIRQIPRASLKLITFWREISLRQSHCRKDNLQCYTGNSWLLQHDDTALFWRVNQLSVLNYAYSSYEFLMKPKESAGCHQTLSARVGTGDETSTGRVTIFTTGGKSD